MKQFAMIFFFFLIPVVNSIGQADTRNNQVIIAGKIHNATRKTVAITSIEPIKGRQKYAAKLNDSGEFKITLDISGPHDYYISYGGLQTIFLEPGDSLYFTADENNFEETIKFSGDNAQSNKVLALFFKSFESLLNSQDFFTNKAELPPIEYKEFVSAFFVRMDSVVNSIQKKEKDLNPKIISWMKAYNKYRRAEDLFEYGSHYKEELPPDYYDFINEYKQKNYSDIFCSQYYEDFLGSYYPYKFSHYKEAKVINAYRENGDYLSYLQSLLKEISKNER